MNWKQRTIDELMAAKGMTETQATTFYNRVYKMALKSVGGKQKNLKISRELYTSMFFQGEQIFTIDNAGTKIEINPILEGSTDIEKTLRLDRMQGFFRTYGESEYLATLRQEYMSGNMTKAEFNAHIKAFKKYNVKYLKSGS